MRATLHFRVLALLLLLFRTCAAADMSHLYKWTTNTTNTTTSTSTTSTSTTTTTNTSTTTNTTSTSTSSTLTTTTTNNMTNNMTMPNVSMVELTTTTTTTTTRTTTTTNTSTTTNFSTTSTMLAMTTTTPANVSNDTNGSMDMMMVVDVNISMNMTYNLTFVPMTYNTTGTTTTTTSGPTTSTSTGTTTCTNCTVTTTMYIWTTVTSTTTSTLAKLCDVPWDPAGNYTLLPWSYRDNSSWDLKCNDTHFPTRGLDHAKCLGNGVLRPAGVCKMSGCNGYDAQWPRGTTCPASMSEGDTCTVMCDIPKEEVFGYWTCIRAQLWGAPTCINKEAKYWWVAWILPKIVGAFDFEGQLTRYVNMTNETLATFKTNVTQAMADCLIGVDPSYFVMFDVIHLWQSKDQYDSETGDLLTYERRHLFSVTYELLIWDVNVYWTNWEAVRAILVPGSHVHRQFEGLLYWRANMTLIELYPTNYPISYNLSYIAPDTETSVAAPCLMDTRRLLLLVALPSSLMYLLRLMLFSEGQS